MKSEHISPNRVNIIFLTPGGSGLERGITQGKFCAPPENFIEGADINYKVILSLNVRLIIVANHPLSPVGVNSALNELSIGDTLIE